MPSLKSLKLIPTYSGHRQEFPTEDYQRKIFSGRFPKIFPAYSFQKYSQHIESEKNFPAYSFQNLMPSLKSLKLIPTYSCHRQEVIMYYIFKAFLQMPSSVVHYYCKIHLFSYKLRDTKQEKFLAGLSGLSYTTSRSEGILSNLSNFRNVKCVTKLMYIVRKISCEA